MEHVAQPEQLLGATRICLFANPEQLVASRTQRLRVLRGPGSESEK